MDLFSALNMGMESLNQNRLALDITGRNIANINTPDYSRQRAVFQATDPSMGSGAATVSIERIHDGFLEAQIQKETQELSNNELSYDNYKVLETYINEPSDSGTGTALTEFWQAWKSLAGPNPSDKTARDIVKTKAYQLIDTMKSTYTRLQDQQVYTNDRILSTVSSINSVLDQIGELNSQIENKPKETISPALLDRRDGLLKQLAKLTNYTANEQANGSIDISISGIPLVMSSKVTHIYTSSDPDSRFDMIISSENEKISDAFTSGEMGAMLNMRDNVMQDLLNNLDTMASTIVSQVNTIHQQGYDLYGNTQANFFTGNNVLTMDLTASIKNNVNTIAASSTKDNVSGNGENAMKISRLQDIRIFDNNSKTVSDFYNEMVTGLANESSYSKNSAENQKIIVTGLIERRESISGVSMDEEITNLMKYEKSYAASAKFVSVINSVIETMIEMI